MSKTKGNIMFHAKRPIDRDIVESAKILAPHFFQTRQNMARMAIHRGLVELAAEKKIKIPLTKTQLADAN